MKLETCYTASMLRRLLVMFLVVSVVSLGLPSFALAAQMNQETTSQSVPHDCICPPGHDLPSGEDASPCMPTHDEPGSCMSVGCMASCAAAQIAVAAEDTDLDPIAGARTALSEAVGPPLSSAYPPFRPPSL